MTKSIKISPVSLRLSIEKIKDIQQLLNTYRSVVDIFWIGHRPICVIDNKIHETASPIIVFRN